MAPVHVRFFAKSDLPCTLQCFQSAWNRPVHANLMFGGVVFGKAKFGMARRSELFISYQWGERKRIDSVAEAAPPAAAPAFLTTLESTSSLSSPSFKSHERTIYSTQEVVSTLKVDLERNTRLTCWFDLDRMGAGINLNTAMHDGVKLAEVFVCCLTDRCASDPNTSLFRAFG